MNLRQTKIALFLLTVTGFLLSCSVTRHIPQDQAVVSRVNIIVDGSRSSDNTLSLAVAQHPYHRTFELFPFAAWIWHNDTTKFFNRIRGKLGTKPPVYDEYKTIRSENSMRRAMINRGYLSAEVFSDTVMNKRKVDINYYVEPGLPHTVASLRVLVEDPLLEKLVKSSLAESSSQVHVGMLLDRSALEEERTQLTSLMRNNGFYDFNKEDISFVADTLRGSNKVDLTLMVGGIHDQYRIGSVRFIPNFNLVTGEAEGDSTYLRPIILREKCFIQEGDLYCEQAVRDTYSALARLHILKYVNVRMDLNSETGLLDCSIFLSPMSPYAVQFELDGTNTSGDLGVAAALSYTHRNLFRGSETYTATLKGGYESLTGDMSGFVNNNYSEYAFENQIDFPRFLCPFISTERRRRINASTAISASYNYQSRPEYTRIITQAGLTYKWRSSTGNSQHNLDAIDLSYVYLPKQSESFQQIIGNLGPISYSSFTSHLILATAYNLYLGNARRMQRSEAADLWSLRLNPEVGGQLLGLASKVVRFKEKDDRYQIFDLPFEQYARFDADFAYSKYLSDRNRLAFHLAGGVAVPYGNSKVMPFEKRYYSGGANSVRGWSVRTLGPGRYRNSKATIDYFNQSGDVRLDASIEFRSRLFWKFESAAFVDAGNVWTIKEYDSQPEGAFSADFYKEIALAWGLGLRLVTDFVVVRLDLGVKGYDPSLSGADAWVIKDPLSKGNRTLHFAVGYPF